MPPAPEAPPRQLLLRVRGLNVVAENEESLSSRAWRGLKAACGVVRPESDRRRGAAVAPAPAEHRAEEAEEEQRRRRASRNALADHPFAPREDDVGRARRRAEIRGRGGFGGKRPRKESKRRSHRLLRRPELQESLAAEERLGQQKKNGRTQLLHDVNLDIEAGRFIAVMGQSGQSGGIRLGSPCLGASGGLMMMISCSSDGSRVWKKHTDGMPLWADAVGVQGIVSSGLCLRSESPTFHPRCRLPPL